MALDQGLTISCSRSFNLMLGPWAGLNGSESMGCVWVVSCIATPAATSCYIFSLVFLVKPPLVVYVCKLTLHEMYVCSLTCLDINMRHHATVHLATHGAALYQVVSHFPAHHSPSCASFISRAARRCTVWGSWWQISSESEDFKV